MKTLPPFLEELFFEITRRRYSKAYRYLRKFKDKKFRSRLSKQLKLLKKYEEGADDAWVKILKEIDKKK